MSAVHQIPWAMQVTTDPSAMTTAAFVNASSVQVATEEEIARQRDSIRKWLDRLKERWLPVFPHTTAAAEALQPLIARDPSDGPVGGKKLMRYCRRVGLNGCIEAFGTVGLPEEAARLLHGASAGSRRRRNVPAAAPVAGALPETSATGGKRKRLSDAPLAAPPAPATAAASGVACSDAEAAKLRLGTCGHCGGELPDCWRPVVDKRPACDRCYASDKTLGAKEVAIYCDGQARIISVAAPDGHPATLEAKIVEALREWNQLREKLESERHLVMGGRNQVQFDRKWGTKSTTQRTKGFRKRVGGKMAELTRAQDLYCAMATAAFELFDVHHETISSMYDRLFPNSGIGRIRPYAVELVDVTGPVDAQFTHNKRVLPGCMQLALFLAPAPEATMHVFWKKGLLHAAQQVRSLRRTVIGNRGLTDDEFENELALDGDLGALVTATSDAEKENVGERLMFPHAVGAGHCQGFSFDVNHFGVAVQKGVRRSLLIALYKREQDGDDKDIEAKQEHGGLKAGHLGLFATVRASQTLQSQLRTEFLTLLTPGKWGVFDAGIWGAMMNPEFDQPIDQRRTSAAVQSMRAETSSGSANGGRRQLALMDASRDKRDVDLKWVEQHPFGLIQVGEFPATLAVAGIRTPSHRYQLRPGQEATVHFTGAYATERGRVTAGQLTIVCQDTKAKVVVKKGQVVQIHRGLRCVLTNEGTTNMGKTYAVFDTHGQQIMEYDAEAEEQLADLTCDGCGKDVWWESYKVGTGDDAKDFCAACLAKPETCTDEARKCAKRHVFDEEAQAAQL
jgi:hypothetical protein